MIVRKEMGITHKDFFRLLPRAMGDCQYVVDGNIVNCTLPTGTLKSTLGPERERKLVLVVLPCTEVVFEFTGVEKKDRCAFTRYFDLRFMRGLG